MAGAFGDVGEAVADAFEVADEFEEENAGLEAAGSLFEASDVVVGGLFSELVDLFFEV